MRIKEELERIIDDTMFNENETWIEDVLGLVLVVIYYGFSILMVIVSFVTVPIWILPYLIYRSKRSEDE